MSITLFVPTGEKYIEREPQLTLGGDRILLGRAANVDMCIPDASISHRHVSIFAKGAGYQIVDEGSLNGTWIKDAQAELRSKKEADLKEPPGFSNVGSNEVTRIEAHVPYTLHDNSFIRLGRVWVYVRFHVVSDQLHIPNISDKEASRDLTYKLVQIGLKASQKLSVPMVKVARAASGSDVGREIMLTEMNKEYLIGRAETCSLQLQDITMSRQHVVIFHRGSSVFVRDLNSTSPAILDKCTMQVNHDTIWRPGAFLELGHTVFELIDPVYDVLFAIEHGPDLDVEPKYVPPAPRYDLNADLEFKRDEFVRSHRCDDSGKLHEKKLVVPVDEKQFSSALYTQNDEKDSARQGLHQIKTGHERSARSRFVLTATEAIVSIVALFVLICSAIALFFLLHHKSG